MVGAGKEGVAVTVGISTAVAMPRTVGDGALVGRAVGGIVGNGVGSTSVKLMTVLVAVGSAPPTALVAPKLTVGSGRVVAVGQGVAVATGWAVGGVTVAVATGVGTNMVTKVAVGWAVGKGSVGSPAASGTLMSAAGDGSVAARDWVGARATKTAWVTVGVAGTVVATGGGVWVGAQLDAGVNAAAIGREMVVTAVRASVITWADWSLAAWC